MLRVMVGLGLKRGKLEAVYAALRGRVPTTGAIDPARREAGFPRLQAARNATLNINRWHHFMGALSLAGYQVPADDYLGTCFPLCLHHLSGGR